MGLLPPLTFESTQVAVAGLLEPAYDVAGDSIDHAVDPGVIHLAIFDGMGHGLRSAQLAILAVSATATLAAAALPTTTASDADQAVERVRWRGVHHRSWPKALRTDTGYPQRSTPVTPEPLLLRGGALVRSLHTGPDLPFGIGLREGETPPTRSGCPSSSSLGDHVLFYTDGVVEGIAPGGEQFGASSGSSTCSHATWRTTCPRWQSHAPRRAGPGRPPRGPPRPTTRRSCSCTGRGPGDGQ